MSFPSVLKDVKPQTAILAIFFYTLLGRSPGGNALIPYFLLFNKISI